MIRCANISHTYGSKEVLKNISFEINTGEVTAVIGPNGSGKSTLLKILSGNITDSRGEVFYHDLRLGILKPRELASCRSVVSQYYPDEIAFTSEEIISMPLTMKHNIQSAKRQFEIIDMVSEMLQIGEYRHRRYSYLSGGERQRVQIARALAQYYAADNSNGFCLFLDEPGSGLDIAAATIFAKLIKEIMAPDLAVFWVLHDINMAISIADNLIAVNQGKVYSNLNPNEILDGKLISEIFGVAMDIYESDLTGKKMMQPRI